MATAERSDIRQKARRSRNQSHAFHSGFTEGNEEPRQEMKKDFEPFSRRDAETRRKGRLPNPKVLQTDI
jgi:hypothetical protein